MQYISVDGSYAAAYNASLEISEGNTKLSPFCVNATIHVHLTVNGGPPSQIMCENLARFAAEGPTLKHMVTDQYVVTSGFALSISPGTMDPYGANNRRYLKLIRLDLEFCCERCDINLYTYRLAQAIDYAMHSVWHATVQIIPSLRADYGKVHQLLELCRSISSILGGVDYERSKIACEKMIGEPVPTEWDLHHPQFMCNQEYTSTSWEVLDSDDHEVLLLSHTELDSAPQQQQQQQQQQMKRKREGTFHGGRLALRSRPSTPNRFP